MNAEKSVIEVLSAESMFKYREILKEKELLEQRPSVKEALQNRVTGIELFIDNCFIKTMAEASKEMKVDTNLFDLPSLAQVLGVQVNQLPQQTKIDFDKVDPVKDMVNNIVHRVTRPQMTAEEIEARKAADPVFKAAMERRAYSKVSDSKGTSFETIYEEHTVEETLKIDFEDEAIKKIAKEFQEKLNTDKFASGIALKLRDLKKIIPATVPATNWDLFKQLIENVEPLESEVPVMKWINSIVEQIKTDRHVINAFIFAKKVLKNWTDEEIANFVTYFARNILKGDAESYLNAEQKLIISLYGDAELQKLINKNWPQVHLTKQVGVNKFEHETYDTKEHKGKVLQIQRIYDLTSPVRRTIMEQRNRKRYVEKGY